MNQTIAMNDNVKLDYIEKYSTLLNLASSGGIFGSGNKILLRASPLLSLALKLRDLSSMSNIGNLKNMLVHQISIVCDSIKRASYGEEIIAATRCALCTFLDECILATDWGMALAWDQNGLAKHFTGEDNDSKRFFAILKELANEPRSNLDVLELFYLCLNLGLAGKYRQQKKGQSIVRELSDDLYNCITCQPKAREDNVLLIKTSDVFTNADVVTATNTTTKAKKSFFASHMLWIFGLMVVLGVVVYESFNMRLNNMFKPLYKTAVISMAETTEQKVEDMGDKV